MKREPLIKEAKSILDNEWYVKWFLVFTGSAALFLIGITVGGAVLITTK